MDTKTDGPPLVRRCHGMEPTRERGRPARTIPGTASPISSTGINRQRRQGSASAGPMRQAFTLRGPSWITLFFVCFKNKERGRNPAHGPVLDGLYRPLIGAVIGWRNGLASAGQRWTMNRQGSRNRRATMPSYLWETPVCSPDRRCTEIPDSMIASGWSRLLFLRQAPAEVGPPPRQIRE